ncbi:MAG TPA: hypothetical protein VK737_09840 [Opitutales bacterium]|jgi:hypothetical protein|nr:hypothetical protein [Opitutales bacterium]
MALSNIWTLKRSSDGLEQSLAAWGVSAARVIRRTQRADSLEIKLSEAKFDEAELFPFSYHPSSIILKRSGVPWFIGYATKTPRMGRPSAEGVSYTFENAWWWLEHTPYTQAWMFTGGVDYHNTGGYLGWTPPGGSPPGTINITNLILGIDVGGNAQTTGWQIIQALGCCQSAITGIGGANPLQIGYVFPGVAAPAEAARDLTCAEVIRRMLRWHPNCVTWWDYTATVSGNPCPALYIKPRSELTSVSFACAGAPASKINIAARPDLVPPVVVINYEIISQNNDQDQRSVTIDQYPSGTPTLQPGGIMLTMDLQGEKTTYLRQYLKTTPINCNILDWWRERLPWLNDANISNLFASANPTGANPSSTNGGTAIPIFPDGGADSSNPNDGTDLASGSTDSGTVWPNMLLEGDIPNWINGNAQMALVQLMVNYDVNMGNDANGNPVIEHHLNEAIFVKVLSTDLNTGWYNQLTGVYLGEPVPTGLAQSYYDALSTLQYEGSWEITEPECGTAGGPYLGNGLNLTGGLSAWASMNATIFETTEDIGTGKTLLRFGPVEYLSPKDWLALLRFQRDRTTGDRQARVNGLLTNAQKPVGGSGRHDRGGSGSKAPPSRDVWVGTPTGGNPGAYKITMAPAQLDSAAVSALITNAANLTIEARLISGICVGGVTKSMLVLCSEPF